MPVELLLQHPFNGLFSRTTWVSRYQKSKTSLYLNEARDDGVLACSNISWTICKRSAPCSRHRQPHRHLITQFLQAGCSSWHPTNSVKALKACGNNILWISCVRTVDYQVSHKFIGSFLQFIMIVNMCPCGFVGFQFRSKPSSFNQAASF